jgi:hypothetical protein
MLVSIRAPRVGSDAMSDKLIGARPSLQLSLPDQTAEIISRNRQTIQIGRRLQALGQSAPSAQQRNAGLAKIR